MSRRFQVRDLTTVVALEIPRGVEAYNQFRDFVEDVTGAALIFVEGVAKEARICRALLKKATAILHDTLALKRGRIELSKMLDLAQICRFVANRFSKKGNRFADIARWRRPIA